MEPWQIDRRDVKEYVLGWSDGASEQRSKESPGVDFPLVDHQSRMKKLL